MNMKKITALLLIAALALALCGCGELANLKNVELPPLPDETLAELVHTLAESGAGVVGLTAQTKNLEEIFLSLTQTSGEVA